MAATRKCSCVKIAMERVEDRLTVSRVELGERVLEFIPPLEIVMKKDPENEKMFVFEEESLGIDVCSPTFDGLDNEIKECIFFLWECIFFLWDTYAKENDCNLSRDAVELKRNLLKRVREISHD